MRQLIRSLAAIALSLVLLGGTAAAACFEPEPEPTPPGIVLSTSTVCGSVTVTAKGFGLWVGTTYQLVADRAVKSVVASLDNTASATFSLAEAGAWGNVSIRTSSGGYLASRADLASGPAFDGLAWYHVTACQ